VRFVSWNVNGIDVWPSLDSDVAVALLQEAPEPINTSPYQVCPANEGEWRTTGWITSRWHRTTAVAAPSGEATLRPYRTYPLHDPVEGGLSVTRPGTVAVCDVMRDNEVLITVASVYASWSKGLNSSAIFADASAHSILSDLSPLMCNRARHRLLVAGDLNLLFGYGEEGSPYWGRRYATVFDRAATMGLVYKGPEAPNGRQADPWPSELPPNSRCVPTYRTNRQTPATATRQLDHVFASESIADQIQVRALNAPDEWGPSDHCKVEMTVAL
jgi:hypothetical protein